MTLADTVTAMLSDDYRARMWAEYQQTLIRTEALQNHVTEVKTGVVLDIEQLDSMRRYLHTLELRCKKEGVEL